MLISQCYTFKGRMGEAFFFFFLLACFGSTFGPFRTKGHYKSSRMTNPPHVLQRFALTESHNFMEQYFKVSELSHICKGYEMFTELHPE